MIWIVLGGIMGGLFVWNETKSLSVLFIAIPVGMFLGFLMGGLFTAIWGACHFTLWGIFLK